MRLPFINRKPKDTFPARKKNELPADWFQVSITDLRKLEMLRLVYSGLELTQRTIEYFTGITVEDTNGYKEKDFLALKTHINFLDTAPATLWQKTICINGMYYHYSYKREKLTAWQLVQMQNLSNNYLDNLHLIAAVLFTEPGKTPEHGFIDRAELFEKRLPVGVILPVASFFLNLLQGLLKATRISLEKRIQKIDRANMKKQKKNGLAKNGDGMPPSQP